MTEVLLSVIHQITFPRRRNSGFSLCVRPFSGRLHSNTAVVRLLWCCVVQELQSMFSKALSTRMSLQFTGQVLPTCIQPRPYAWQYYGSLKKHFRDKDRDELKGRVSMSTSRDGIDVSGLRFWFGSTSFTSFSVSELCFHLFLYSFENICLLLTRPDPKCLCD
jgi:hypothetical protein